MSIYNFKAKDALGVEKTGTVEAPDRESALTVLKNQNLLVVSLTEKSSSFLDNLSFIGGVKTNDVVEFSRQFSTMINSGLTISKSLQICAEQTTNSKFRSIMLEIVKDVDGGTTLSKAMSKYPTVFDISYSSLVKAGESSGKLDVIMARIADTYEANRDLKSRLQSAMVYPAIIMVIMVLVIIVLIVYVIPKLKDIFTTLDQDLPFITQALVNLSNFVVSFWYLLLLGVTGAFLFLRYYFSTEVGRGVRANIILSLPVIGKVIKQTELSNYMRTLGLLIGSGVQINEALIIASKVSDVPKISNSSIEASRYLEKGNSLSSYLRQNKFFDPIISSMVGIGEETGKIDELLDKVANNYANESSYAIKGLSSAIEPIILVLLGVSVGGIILAVIIPIFSIINTVGGQ